MARRVHDNAVDTTTKQSIVHSNQALNTVGYTAKTTLACQSTTIHTQAARLLGIHNVQQLLHNETAGDQEVLNPRPQGLGLGAKFLPHNKVLLLFAQGGDDSIPHTHMHTQAVGIVGGVRNSLGKRLRAPAPNAAPSSPPDEEQEEVDGRAAAFRGSNETSGKVPVSLKQQLIDEAGTGGGRKKKKKKQRKKDTARMAG